MIITLNGKPGSGKSSIAKALAAELGYQRYYMGQVRRDLAKQQGMTLAELNALGEKEDWTDRQVETEVQRLGRAQDNFIIESRTAWHFIPQSLKIFLDVSLMVGAERIFKHLQKADAERNEAASLTSVRDVERANQERIASDTRRYQKYYGLDVLNPSNYDLWLDTTHLSQTQVYERVLSFVKQALNSR